MLGIVLQAFISVSYEMLTVSYVVNGRLIRE